MRLKRLSLLVVIAAMFFAACKGPQPADTDPEIRAGTYTPAASYQVGETFVLDNVSSYFQNNQAAVYTTDVGTIEGDTLTISLTQVGELTVTVTGTREGKSAYLRFTLNVAAASTDEGISAKTFTPSPNGYSIKTDFVLELPQYFNNAQGAAYQCDRGVIEDEILTIELETPGALDVTVTATKGGKSADLSFTLDVLPIWNKAPTVTRTYYDDFSQGLNAGGPNRYEISNQKWGENNNGTWSGNVFYSTDEDKAAAEGCESGGIVAMRSHGDLQPDLGPNNKRPRQGAAIITREAFGPGLYEVRMKVVPRVGPCTAVWTYWGGNGGTTVETNQYSEIDIEMPMQADYRKWGGTSYKRFAGFGNPVTHRGTATVDKADGVNDGQWHTWAFEWRTAETDGDDAVIWYLDGKKMIEMRDYTPNYTATFWIGNWFPSDLGWVGNPLFQEAWMYIDWLRITQYGDPVSPGATGSAGTMGSAVDLGNAPIPQNLYIANSDFSDNAAELDPNNGLTTQFTGWEKTTAASTVTGGGRAPLLLGEASGVRQMLLAQYPGYTFELKLDAKIASGTGKLKAYVQYMFGSVAMGKSQQLLIDSDVLTSKTLRFTIPPGNTSNIRIVIETEAGTTAHIEKVELFKTVGD